jgi:hypothetical protein
MPAIVGKAICQIKTGKIKMPPENPEGITEQKIGISDSFQYT